MSTATPKRIAGPQTVGTSGAVTTLATVPALHTYIVKQIIITNTSAAARTVVISIGDPVTVGNRIVSDMPIAANEVITIDTAITLAAAETLRAYADTTAVVGITVNGWDYAT